MKTKLTAGLLCVLFCFCMIAWNVKAEPTETAEYLALGDSISAAYGLGSEEEGFVHLVAQAFGLTSANRAVSGNTAEGILAELQSGELDSLIADAALITITCGGNDLMNVLYDAVAELHNLENGTSYTGRDVIAAFGGMHEDPLLDAISFFPDTLKVLEDFTETEEFRNSLSTYENNMFGENGVLSYIRERNTEAEIIIATQYNPYKSFEKTFFEIVSTKINEGALLLNEVIQKNASEWNYTVADVHAAFLSSRKNLCNANFSSSNFDFHPNAAGHAVLAKTVMEVSSFEILFCPTCGTAYENGICPECESGQSEESTTSESETTTTSETTTASETTTISETTSASESTSDSHSSDEENFPSLSLIFIAAFLTVLILGGVIFIIVRKKR